MDRGLHSRNAMSRGFTLVEVLIALAIIVGVITGAAQLAGMAIRTNLRAATMTTTVMVAQNKLEEILGDPSSDGTLSPPGTLDADIRGWSDIVDQSGRVRDASNASNRDYVRRWAVEPLAASGTLVVQVVVLRGDVRIAMVGARASKGR